MARITGVMENPGGAEHQWPRARLTGVIRLRRAVSLLALLLAACAQTGSKTRCGGHKSARQLASADPDRHISLSRWL